MADLEKKTTEELKKMLNEKREHLRDFRFGIAGTRIRNVRDGRDTKKGIAQILTELNAREQSTSK